jgi:Tfp pilus assembly protein PilF
MLRVPLGRCDRNLALIGLAETAVRVGNISDSLLVMDLLQSGSEQLSPNKSEKLQAAQVRSQLAESYLRSKQDQPALAEWAEALEFEPDYLPALLGKGETLGRVGRIQEGAQTLLDAANLYPSDGSVWAALASFYLDDAAEPLVAARYAKVSIILDARNVQALRVLTIFSQSFSRCGDAVQYGERWVQVAPDDYWAWLELANASWSCGEHASASLAYNRFLELAPVDVREQYREYVRARLSPDHQPNAETH